MTQQDRDVIARFTARMEHFENETLQRLTSIETTLKGNGGKGHEQRLDNLEGYVQTHPSECPFVKRKIPRGQLIAMCIAGASLATTWIVVLL